MLDCDSGFMGERCDIRCRFGPHTTCHRYNGICEAACGLGYMGAQCLSPCCINCGSPSNECDLENAACQSCDASFWGKTCLNTCGGNCAGNNNECKQLSGACVQGCNPGCYGSKFNKGKKGKLGEVVSIVCD